jgi:heme/copper-type cytochrome/quinol oxidase subunit 3
MAATMRAQRTPAVPGASDRPRPLVVATFLVIVAGVMLFAGLLGSYGFARSEAMDSGQEWLPATVLLPNLPIAITYLSLAMSSVTAQWSVAAIISGARTQMYVAVGLTLVLGAAFINGLTFIWQRLGLGAVDNDFATWMYALTVTHLVVVVAAMVLFVVMGFRALGGQFSAKDRQFVDCAAAFWHFMVVAGAAIWFSIWFLEGKPT